MSIEHGNDHRLPAVLAHRLAAHTQTQDHPLAFRHLSQSAETGQHWTSILGLTLTATAAEVNAKYRKMVIEGNLHPDMGGDRTEFERLTNARREALEELANGHYA